MRVESLLQLPLRRRAGALPEGPVGILDPHQFDPLSQAVALVLIQSLHTYSAGRRSADKKFHLFGFSRSYLLFASKFPPAQFVQTDHVKEHIVPIDGDYLFRTLVV